jgi:hypothetical protein
MCVVPDALADLIVMRAWEEKKTNQEVMRDAIREYFDKWEPEDETVEKFAEEEEEEEDGDDDDEDGDDDEEDGKKKKA